jgi:hypothetical protein
MGWFSAEQPLWLPQGSIRALLTFGIIAVTVYLLISGGGSDKAVPEWLVALVVFITKDYFAVREAEHARKAMRSVLSQAEEERSEERKINQTVIENMTGNGNGRATEVAKEG